MTNLNQKKTTAWLIAAGFALVAYGIWWMVTPHTFEQCVQKNLKNANTNGAVMEIRRTCQAQHGR